MAGIRQLRIVGLTALVIVLIFVLHRVGQNAASLVHAQASDQIGNIHRTKSNSGPVMADQLGVPATGKLNPVVVSNKLVDSQNDEKTDQAINDEIYKDKSEEGVKKVDKDSGKNRGSSVDSGSGSGSGSGSDVGTGGKALGETSNNQETTNEKGEYDPHAELIKIRSLSPMTIFSKSYCPYSKKLKKLLLEKYEIIPAPNVVELDIHEHGAELQNYLAEKSGRRTVPNVLVGSSFESRGGSDDFEEFHQKNEIISILTEWGQGRLQAVKKDAPSNA